MQVHSPILKLKEQHGSTRAVIRIQKRHSRPTAYFGCLADVISAHEVRLHSELLLHKRCGDASAVYQARPAEIVVEPVVVVTMKVGKKVRFNAVAL